MSRVWMLISIAFANAFRGVRQASTTSLLAVLTIAVVLVLVGSASLLVENMAGLYLSGKVVGQAERIELKVADEPVTLNVASDGSFASVIDIFGTGGAQKISDLFDVPKLGTIPLDPAVRKGGDAGRPVTMTAPESGIATSFRELAGEMARRVSTLNLS